MLESGRTSAARLRWGAGILTSVVAGAAIGAAQTQPTFRAEANYVRIDVYATRDGAPVTSLSRDDFEVFDKDLRQQIEEFRLIAFGPGRERRPEPRAPAETRPPGRRASGRRSSR